MWAQVLAGLAPSPTIDAQRCTRGHASGCTACVQSCPRDALTLTPDRPPVADPGLCVSCGLCEAACPTRALSGVAAAPGPVVSTAEPDGVRLRCEPARLAGMSLADDTGRPGLDVGCAATIHPETLAAAASHGPVDLVVGDCSECSFGGGGGASLVAAVARTIAGGQVRVVTGDPDSDPAAAEPAARPSAPLSRRGLFGRGTAVVQAARSAAQSRGTTASTASDQTPRALLLERTDSPRVMLPVISQDCTGCLACVRTCTSNALSERHSADGVSLCLAAQQCIGCQDCARLCPESAISLTPRPAVSAPQPLTTVTTRHCSSCGRSLAAGESDRCTACTSRGSLATEALAHLFG